MDFHSLLRRDLQFLCKRNKIPANMTNLAMADALKALEIVEGLDEGSTTVVAKQPLSTATRTTRRKTTMKAEPESSSQFVSRSCLSTSKSLAGEMDQENINKNVAQESKINSVKFEANVLNTPAARSTRKASVATSCSSKVLESKKDELVQSVYSTRRSTRLLEKCMADLSLKTRETLDNPAKKEDTEQKVSSQEKNQAVSEAEVIPGRDLNVSMEQVWENLKNDSDQVVGHFEVNVAVLDANTETNKEEMNEVTADEKVHENGLVVPVEKQEETLQAICEEEMKKNNNDLEIFVDVGDIPVYANTETNNDNKESKKGLALDSSEDQQETEQATQENESEPEKVNNIDEDTMVSMVQGDSDTGDSETDPEEDNSSVDSDSTISEADSNQAVRGSDIADEEIFLSELEDSPNSPPILEESKVKTAPLSPSAAESISVQFPRPTRSTTPSKNSALKMVNVDKENNMEMMMNVNKNENGEKKGEEAKKKKKTKLEDVSLRQLEKMCKKLSIENSNRPALQILPGNNQTAE